jgi:Flp pilus assembly protein TadD
MPAVTAWVFAVGGAAAAGRAGRGRAAADDTRTRVPVAAALVVAAATPALLLFSQSRLDASAEAFNKRDCKRARTEAFKSIDTLSLRPEPFRIVGYCDIEDGRASDGVAAMQKALDNGPRNWESHFGLAIALAAAGRDPGPEIERAQALDPLEEVVDRAAKAFSTTRTPSNRERAAKDAMEAALGNRRLTLR